jgi:solute carrier family 25 phosphate transporter 3
VLGTIVMTSSLLLSSGARAQSYNCGLEDLAFGHGQWTKASDFNKSVQLPVDDSIVPATFCTYTARFLLNFDEGSVSWWRGIVQANSLLPQDEARARLGRTFGSLARSIQIALHDFVTNADDVAYGYEQLLRLFLANYASTSDEARRHLGLLFAILPAGYQPTRLMQSMLPSTMSIPNVEPRTSRVVTPLQNEFAIAPPQPMQDDLTALLPQKFKCVQTQGSGSYTIYPPVSLYEIGIDEEFGQTATATMAGPLASFPLKRELPHFNLHLYTLFGICGGTGCALTHSTVIPLDVVKTRMQTDPETASGSLIESGMTILKNEGIEGLLLGSQATVAGYFWYGISVYPCYTFFKRWMSQSLLSPELATAHINDIALIAGALAAVVASLGLTPIEAARIRTVAEPLVYKAKGLLGTLGQIATEDEVLGWRSLYAGLPSLLTRQVIFGSIKFLAFERACEAIFNVWPVLQDATWTSLLVSLVAGGFSGALSSVVSHPADAVLTYVAQNSKENLGVLEGSLMMVEREGLGSLFRGLGSRCVWAGSIIAGQFLLYDVFRTYFGVNSDDLSQVFQIVIPIRGSTL